VTKRARKFAFAAPAAVSAGAVGAAPSNAKGLTDKCAWAPETQNITLGGHLYAVQALWSNEALDAGGDPCAVSR
jgi:hypothetical protein